MLETALVGIRATTADITSGDEHLLLMLHVELPERNSEIRFLSECLTAVCSLLSINVGPDAKLVKSNGSYMDALRAQSIIKKLSLPMLQHTVTVLAGFGLIPAAMGVVQYAVMLRPADTILQAWQKTLQTAGSDAHTDKIAVAAALQPFEPKTAASMADAARLRFYHGETAEGLADLSKALDLDPDDAQNLARRGYLKATQGDIAGTVADLQQADRISPLQDFEHLALLGKLTKNQDPAYAVSIFDRALCAKPITYPPRLAYARIYQQWGACKGTLQQCSSALEDLDMALKLGSREAKIYMCKSAILKTMGDHQGVLRQLDEAVSQEPGNATSLTRGAQLKHDMHDIKGAERDFCAAEAIEPFPIAAATERQQTGVGTWRVDKQNLSTGDHALLTIHQSCTCSTLNAFNDLGCSTLAGTDRIVMSCAKLCTRSVSGMLELPSSVFILWIGACAFKCLM